jgi:hypothetical protein
MTAAPISIVGPPALVPKSGAQALKWLLAVAFAGVTHTLLSTRNDDFDLAMQRGSKSSSTRSGLTPTLSGPELSVTGE